MEKGTNERVPTITNLYRVHLGDHKIPLSPSRWPTILHCCVLSCLSHCSRITACTSSRGVLKTNVTLCPSVNANEFRVCTSRHLCPLERLQRRSENIQRAHRIWIKLPSGLHVPDEGAVKVCLPNPKTEITFQAIPKALQTLTSNIC